MDETPFYKKPWFYIAGWLALLVVFYGWQVYRMGGIQATILYVVLDLACIFPGLLFLWVAFFAQFVLPVQTAEDRQKIVERLLSYLSGYHGPALFIENGIVREHAGERLKTGPGVVWLDSASAAVTRTATKVKQTMGPGVHFFDKGEYFVNTPVDLHIQSQTLSAGDNPFESDSDQDSRKQVSALTRDGIEVIPTISVSFRIATGFPKEGELGSRFGYRTGISKLAKENEARDKEAIRKAILGEGVNPNNHEESYRRRAAWNQLPAQLAVDVWREYLAKFTADELFAKNKEVLPPPPKPPEPSQEEIDFLSQPIQVGERQNRLEDSLTARLREINKILDRIIKWLEGSNPNEASKVAPQVKLPQPTTKVEPQLKTAAQVINDMVKARLTQPEVDVLDEHGRRVPGQTMPSPEFKLLQRRGLEVRSASIGNIRFPPQIEETMIKRWSATWLSNAKDESKQIERRRQLLTTAGQEKAISKYAEKLSTYLLIKKPQGVSNTLKALVTRTRNIVLEDEQLRQEMLTHDKEIFEAFEAMIKWVEVKGK